MRKRLSDWFKAEVRRDGKLHAIMFERGKTVKPLEVVGSILNNPLVQKLRFFQMPQFLLKP